LGVILSVGGASPPQSKDLRFPRCSIELAPRAPSQQKRFDEQPNQQLSLPLPKEILIRSGFLQGTAFSRP
jgi:hypothetical protein